MGANAIADKRKNVFRFTNIAITKLKNFCRICTHIKNSVSEETLSNHSIIANLLIKPLAFRS